MQNITQVEPTSVCMRQGNKIGSFCPFPGSTVMAGLPYLPL